MEGNPWGLHFSSHSFPLLPVGRYLSSVQSFCMDHSRFGREKWLVPGGAAETFLCQWAPADAFDGAVINYPGVTCVLRAKVANSSCSHFGRERLATASRYL